MKCKKKLQQVNSIAEFFRTVFHPKEMYFHTSLSLFIILVLGLFGTSTLFWAFTFLFLAIKSVLTIHYYRYWKAWEKLVVAEMNAKTDDNDEIDEKTVCEFIEVLKPFKRKAIEISFASSEDAARTGCSKYGGQPDVPEDFQWPLDNNNRPLSLLLQINCSDLTPIAPEDYLPKSGHLYFFYELGEQNWEGAENSIRVIYIDTQHKELHRIDYPKTLANEFRLKERVISFKTKDSYPAFQDFGNQNTEYNQLIDKVESFNEARSRLETESSSNAIGTMFGYADLIHDVVVNDLNTNILLLQLSSIEDDSYELLFGDCGNIYFYISRHDLQTKDFRHVKFELQCY
ncbi:YwqG family protein [Bacteroides cellulosilyticus]|uniref:YwqG family protein n=1 Tax=Bacteroides cellulosilyticus TaxID=246787 RepID=UPI0032F030A7